MATATRLIVCQGNDPTVDITVSSEGEPLSLSGLDVELWIKPSAATDDADDAVTTLTLDDGLALGSAVGTLVAVIPDAALSTPGERFWRLDVLQSGARTTVMYGPLVITDV